MDEFANHNPEQREECKAISQDFKELSVHLLDQCINTDEAKVILEDHTGTSKYFRFSKDMSLPRLHLAIEHNHKEFVSHALCQQVFRHFYEQNVPWHGKSLRFKFLHILLQILMAPILVGMSLFTWIGKEFSSRYGIKENEPSLYGVKKCYEEDMSWQKSFINKIIDYFTLNQLSLNVPLNRFLIFSGYYFIFVGLLVGAIVDKSINGNGFCFGEYQILLTIYIISMIWQDVSLLSNVRTFRTYFKLWRVYDLIMHITLVLALLFRAITATNSCYKVDVKTTPTPNQSTTPIMNLTTLTMNPAMNPTTTSLHQDDPWNGLDINTAEVVLFALAATMAIVR